MTTLPETIRQVQQMQEGQLKFVYTCGLKQSKMQNKNYFEKEMFVHLPFEHSSKYDDLYSGKIEEEGLDGQCEGEELCVLFHLTRLISGKFNGDSCKLVQMSIFQKCCMPGTLTPQLQTHADYSWTLLMVSESINSCTEVSSSSSPSKQICVLYHLR